MEDVKQTAVATEEKKTNVTESDTDGLNYTHVFKKPFEFEGKTYDKLTFDFRKGWESHRCRIRENNEVYSTCRKCNKNHAWTVGEFGKFRIWSAWWSGR